MRVDFVDTVLLSPVRGQCTHQSLTVTGSVWPLGVKQVGWNICQNIFHFMSKYFYFIMISFILCPVLWAQHGPAFLPGDREVRRGRVQRHRGVHRGHQRGGQGVQVGAVDNPGQLL